MEERMMEKRPRGRPKAGMMDELMESSYVKMERRAAQGKRGMEKMSG